MSFIIQSILHPERVRTPTDTWEADDDGRIA
jgi:hypothetical protein